MHLNTNLKYTCELAGVIVAFVIGGFVWFELAEPDLLLLIIAAALICVGTNALVTYADSKSWIVVEARIVRISEQWKDVALRFSRLRYFYPVVEFEYEYGGVKYTSNKMTFDIRNVWVPELDKWGGKTDTRKMYWRSWEAGQGVPAFVDPKNPANSVILNTLSADHKSQGIALIAGGLLVGLCWALLVAWK